MFLSDHEAVIIGFILDVDWRRISGKAALINNLCGTDIPKWTNGHLKDNCFYKNGHADSSNLADFRIFFIDWTIGQFIL